MKPWQELKAPAGKEAEWALMKLAKMHGVDLIYDTWQELADAIIEAIERNKNGANS